MSRNIMLGAVVLILAVAGYFYWRKSSNPTGGGTQALNSAVQQDLAYYQAWNDAQQQTNNTSTPSTGSPGGTPTGIPVGTGGYLHPLDQSTTQSAAMTLPAGV